MSNHQNKNVLFVSHDATRAGAQMVLLHLLRWLKENSNHSLRLLLRAGGPLTDDFRAVVDTTVLHDQISSNANKSRLASLVSNFKGKFLNLVPGSGAPVGLGSYDLVYSNTITNGELVDTLSSIGVPVLTHVHEMSYWIERAGRNNLTHVKRQSSHFIAASHATKQNLVDTLGISSNSVEVVHEFIPATSSSAEAHTADLANVRLKLGIPIDAFVVGGSGHESWRKGRDLFVQLASMIKRANPSRKIHFLWVGHTGDREDQFRLAHDSRLAGVADRVHWSGEVSNPAIYFKEFNVFAMLSREDPFPLVCLETALLAKPIICFADAGGIPELVEDDCGFTVDYLDLPAVAEHVLRLASDATLTAKLGGRAREKVLARHTTQKAAPLILAIIDRLLTNCKELPGPRP